MASFRSAKNQQNCWGQTLLFHSGDNHSKQEVGPLTCYWRRSTKQRGQTPRFIMTSFRSAKNQQNCWGHLLFHSSDNHTSKGRTPRFIMASTGSAQINKTAGVTFCFIPAIITQARGRTLLLTLLGFAPGQIFRVAAPGVRLHVLFAPDAEMARFGAQGNE